MRRLVSAETGVMMHTGEEAAADGDGNPRRGVSLGDVHTGARAIRIVPLDCDAVCGVLESPTCVRRHPAWAQSTETDHADSGDSGSVDELWSQLDGEQCSGNDRVETVGDQETSLDHPFQGSERRVRSAVMRARR